MIFSGMVGLQRPQGEPGLKPEDLEEDNKMICLSNQDEFVLSQVAILKLNVNRMPFLVRNFESSSWAVTIVDRFGTKKNPLPKTCQ